MKKSMILGLFVIAFGQILVANDGAITSFQIIVVKLAWAKKCRFKEMAMKVRQCFSGKDKKSAEKCLGPYVKDYNKAVRKKYSLTPDNEIRKFKKLLDVALKEAYPEK